MSSPEAPTSAPASASKYLFDISGIDLDAVVATREEIAKVNPHRGNMALLDAVVWISPDKQRAIAKTYIRGDEFWVSGHFPGKPLFPGVLQIECGAQLANWLFNIRTPVDNISALLGVSDASFRTPVEPGQTLYILIEAVKSTARRFTSRAQGIVNDSVTFECTASGITINQKKQ